MIHIDLRLGIKFALLKDNNFRLSPGGKVDYIMTSYKSIARYIPVTTINQYFLVKKNSDNC